MLFSEASGRKVVSTSTADTVGKINEFLVDPRTRQVVGLHLKKTSDGDTLRWPDIASFGVDAVTVTGADRIVAADEELAKLTGKAHRILGKRVLCTTGDEIGTVQDVDFDPSSGTITALALDTGSVEGERLIGIGSYAVVVRTGRMPAQV